MIQCIHDVFLFLFFYLVFLFYFFLMFLVSGANVSPDDYSTLQPLTHIWIQVFRNSIGDIATPQFDYWDHFLESDSELRDTGVLLIWLIWFFEILFMLVILLNFLIAIIS